MQLTRHWRRHYSRTGNVSTYTRWRGNTTGLSDVVFTVPLLAKSYYVSLTLNKSPRPSYSEVSGKYIGCNFLFTSLTRPTGIGFCL
jgi:hypothetical protein